MYKANNKDLSRQELENLLPDYAFGRLSAEDKELFERSIAGFPELQKEADEIRSAFSLVSREEYEEFTSRSTRNLSVKVLERMREKKSPAGSIYTRYFAPGFAAAILMLTFMPGGLMERFSPAGSDLLDTLAHTSVSAPTELSRQYDIAEPVESSYRIAEALTDEQELNQVLNSIMTDELVHSAENIDPEQMVMPVNPAALHHELIDELSDEDVELVLKDLNNVDFS